MLNPSNLEKSQREADSKSEHFRTDHLLVDLAGKSARGGVVTVAAQSAKFLLQMLSTMVLARVLSPKDFGLIAMVTAITGFVAVFKDCGLSEATVQRLKITHAQVSNLFWVNLLLSICVTLFIAALAPVISWFYHEPRLTPITLVLSTTFIFSGMVVQHQALLRRQMRFKALASIDVASMLSGAVVGVVMGVSGCNYWSLVGLTFTSTVVNCILVWIKCEWRPSLFERGAGAREMLAFGGNLTGFTVLNYFTRNFDCVLIGRVLGSVSVGIYSKAYGLLSLPIGQINAPISTVMLPALCRLQDNPTEYTRLYLRALGVLSFLTVPLVVFSFAFAHDLVLVLLGRQWLPAVVVFQMLAPAALVSAINIAPGWLCTSLGHPRKQLNYGLISAPLCIAAFIIGLKWGLEGIAGCFSLTFFILFWVFTWYASLGTPVRFLQILRIFCVTGAISCVAGSITWAVRMGPLSTLNPTVALMICMILFAIVYLLTAMLFGQTRLLVLESARTLPTTLRSIISRSE
jgi:PST family polysaccharide transporter